MSRAEAARKFGQSVEMVELEAGDYLLSAMIDLGPVRDAGMGGRRATDWPEILTYADATGRISRGVEAEIMRAMCVRYLSGMVLGEDPMSISSMEREGGDQ